MSKGVQRRERAPALAAADPQACADWQHQSLRHAWIRNLDATVKPICGSPEGAELGCHPHQPGRPSHVCPGIFERGLRRVLDVEERPGNQHRAPHSRENRWRLWARLPPECRPWLLCGGGNGNRQDPQGERAPGWTALAQCGPAPEYEYQVLAPHKG